MAFVQHVPSLQELLHPGLEKTGWAAKAAGGQVKETTPIRNKQTKRQADMPESPVQDFSTSPGRETRIDMLPPGRHARGHDPMPED